ncbi:MAG: sla2 Src-like adaptor 2 [Watsoniomyces obsoletus]|nr:MAG: sla2 Src-like adaptor 2 [Watsoniomyces obsoletus]
MEPFKVRLNCIDHYQTTPTPLDPPLNGEESEGAAPKVPVIRVFGATPTGQKVCAHIHGALPYLYIDYEGELASDEVKAYILRIHRSIDHALGISYRRDLSGDKCKFVAYISIVKGTPFYGYYEGYKYYLKIYLFNPLHMTRLSDLLRQGAVMKRFFQPYESHLQYLLQWMCDYNLYGCDYITCSRPRFRDPVPQYEDLDSAAHAWHDQSISPESILDEVNFPRLSHCSIEVDICVQDILNRKDIKARPIHHDFIERLHPPPSDEKLVHSMAGLWKDETRRRRALMNDENPNSSPFHPEDLITMSAEPRPTQKGGWIHEAEYMAEIRRIIARERPKYGHRRIQLESFTKKPPRTEEMKSALESVEDLFPENLRVMPELNGTPHGKKTIISDVQDADVEVDESRILDQPEDAPIYASDEEPLVEAEPPPMKNEGVRKAVQTVNGGGDAHRKADAVTYGDQKAAETSLDDGKKLSDTSGDGQRFQRDDGLSMTALPQPGPVTVNELAAYGIHPIGQLTLATQAKFEIPREYTNGSGSINFSRKHPASTWPEPELKSKRRKITEIEDVNRRHTAAADHTGIENADGRTADEDDGGTKDIIQSRVPSQGEAQFDGPDCRSAEEGDISVSQPSAVASRRSSMKGSQESIKAGASSNSKTVSFQVVKDPHRTKPKQKFSEQIVSGEHFETPTTSKQTSFKSGTTEKGASTSHISSSTVMLKDDSESLKMIEDVARNLHVEFGATIVPNRILCLKHAPPSVSSITSSTQTDSGMPMLYQEAYYSDEKDVPQRPREYAGREFWLRSNTVPYLPDFDPPDGSAAERQRSRPKAQDILEKQSKIRRLRCSLRTWEIGQRPPTRREVEAWALEERKQRNPGRSISAQSNPRSDAAPTHNLSQIDGPTQKHRHGFKFSQKKKSSSIKRDAQYMSTMSLEIHVNTRGDLVPNPAEDEIACVFWCYQSDDDFWSSGREGDVGDIGILALSEDGGLAQKFSREVPVHVEEESSELDLINRMIDIVRYCDPDILTGYEVHDGSWGYMIERARCKYDYNLCDEFSRMKSQSHGRFGKDNDRWGFNHTSTIRVTGRHMINIWRAMRGELNLLQYTLENVAFHLLHKRIPRYSHKDLTTWYRSNKSRDVAKVLDYFITRIQIDLQILEKNELIPRTSEQARILGVDFFSVFSRGSQFKVESLMFRIAKAEDYMLVSPSRKQVGQQNALECLPLVMEPQSDFYTSPLLVLDFQSLYPSIMIAYNYCYSTFLGRIVGWRGQNKMGFTDYKREARVLELLEDQINISPNGMMYVKPETRKSLLAKMLGEILETRVMVKSGMKINKDDKALQQLLNNRQLALKLIANVTYGYTSASFSGRMPCSEIADSIVQTARETLEKAIALIHSVERWGAEVVYGDTDSLFIYLKGRSKDAAFAIGNEIAEAVTQRNPRPIKLKFEKVYHPCVLLAKKRYVGFKYEHKDQQEPDFDAKGIETVRRDGTPAEQKIEETALKILFRTADLSQVKRYFQKQCNKIMLGKVSIQDFCFAKEVKLGSYSDKGGPPPPGAMVSVKKMQDDPRAEPQYGERVPYVVIAGAPGARLIDRCVAPETLLNNEYVYPSFLPSFLPNRHGTPDTRYHC